MLIILSLFFFPVLNTQFGPAKLKLMKFCLINNVLFGFFGG
jgi:hypothetical protein